MPVPTATTRNLNGSTIRSTCTEPEVAGLEKELIAINRNIRGTLYPNSKFWRLTFSGLPSNHWQRIMDFLRACKLFDHHKSRWRNIPNATSNETDLFNPILEIISRVIEDFRYTNREVVDTRVEVPNNILKPAADITIEGVGGKGFPTINFEPQDDDQEVSHLFCASFVEVRTSKTRDFSKDVKQLAFHAKKCFSQQHNRRFVYGLLMTESHVQLFMFDRAGVYYSGRININENPADFIHIILGIVSPDDHVIGFDTSIFWHGERRFLSTFDTQEQPVVYELVPRQPFFSQDDIVDRGTVCWRVTDSNGRKLVIKDTWVDVSRDLERRLLTKAMGLLGVGQMVACEMGERISEIRGIEMSGIPQKLKDRLLDRVFTRVTFEDGGKPISDFSSRKEVLYALRDAIAGHQRLWNAGILHRDVSANNVLIGPSGSQAGQRGLIIDLDMATFLDPKMNISMFDHDDQVGTKGFQSVNVLHSYDDDIRPRYLPHDYRDDLEAFFYVLCLTCCGYEKPGESLKPFPQFIEDWWLDDEKLAAAAKRDFYLQDTETMVQNVKPFFGEVFERLLKKYFKFCKTKMLVRTGLKARKSPVKTLLQLQPLSDRDYKTVLRYLDQAIEELASLTIKMKPRSQRQRLPGHGRKRRAGHDDDELIDEERPVAKKCRK